MRDQAYSLRAMAGSNLITNAKAGTGPRVIAVTSGKGGVGKTSIVVNLSIILAKMSQRVVILDTDLGLANVELLLGLNPPGSFYDVLFGNKMIKDIIFQGPHGIGIVSGGSGMKELADLDRQGRERIISSLGYFNGNADFVFIDTGAGISRNVLGFVAAAGEVIIVVTPEPTSIADAYSMIKVLATYKVHSGVNIIVNRALNEQEALQTASKIITVTKKFLQINVNHIGSIYEDRVVIQAAKMQHPFILSKPNSAASTGLQAIARSLLGEKTHLGGGMESFLKKLFRLYG